MINLFRNTPSLTFEDRVISWVLDWVSLSFSLKRISQGSGNDAQALFAGTVSGKGLKILKETQVITSGNDSSGNVTRSSGNVGRPLFVSDFDPRCCTGCADLVYSSDVRRPSTRKRSFFLTGWTVKFSVHCNLWTRHYTTSRQTQSAPPQDKLSGVSELQLERAFVHSIINLRNAGIYSTDSEILTWSSSSSRRVQERVAHVHKE